MNKIGLIKNNALYCQTTTEIKIKAIFMNLEKEKLIPEHSEYRNLKSFQANVARTSLDTINHEPQTTNYHPSTIYL